MHGSKLPPSLVGGQLILECLLAFRTASLPAAARPDRSRAFPNSDA